jgi:hypothetical protein
MSFVKWSGWGFVAVVVGVYTTDAASAGTYTSEARTCSDVLYDAKEQSIFSFYEAAKFHENPEGDIRDSPARKADALAEKAFSTCKQGRCDFFKRIDAQTVLMWSESLAKIEAGSVIGDTPEDRRKFAFDMSSLLAASEFTAANAAGRSEPRQALQVIRNWFCTEDLGKYWKVDGVTRARLRPRGDGFGDNDRRPQSAQRTRQRDCSPARPRRNAGRAKPGHGHMHNTVCARYTLHRKVSLKSLVAQIHS